MSTLIMIVVVLVIIGVVLWLIDRYIPMTRPVRNILRIVVAIFVILWLLSVFGIFHI